MSLRFFIFHCFIGHPTISVFGPRSGRRVVARERGSTRGLHGEKLRGSCQVQSTFDMLMGGVAAFMEMGASALALHQSLGSFFSAPPFPGSRSASPPARGLSLFVLFGPAASGLHLLRPPASGLRSPVSGLWSLVCALHSSLSTSLSPLFGLRSPILAISSAWWLHLPCGSAHSVPILCSATTLQVKLLSNCSASFAFAFAVTVAVAFVFVLVLVLVSVCVFVLVLAQCFSLVTCSVLCLFTAHCLCSFPFPSGSCQLLVSSRQLPVPICFPSVPHGIKASRAPVPRVRKEDALQRLQPLSLLRPRDLRLLRGGGCADAGGRHRPRRTSRQQRQQVCVHTPLPYPPGAAGSTKVKPQRTSFQSNPKVIRGALVLIFFSVHFLRLCGKCNYLHPTRANWERSGSDTRAVVREWSSDCHRD